MRSLYLHCGKVFVCELNIIFENLSPIGWHTSLQTTQLVASGSRELVFSYSSKMNYFSWFILRRWEYLGLHTSNGRMTGEWCTGKVWKEAAMAETMHYPAFAWRDWGKPRKSVRILCCPCPDSNRALNTSLGIIASYTNCWGGGGGGDAF
jgi:hypothetical protein